LEKKVMAEKERFPVTLLVENIRSLYNVGSLFRTCDGAGVEKIYLCGYTGYPPRKEIEKSALGSTESVPWERAENILEAIDLLKEEGVTLYALEKTDHSVSYEEADYRFPAAFVVGNEVDGVTHEVLEACDSVIHLPMYGMKESLNVAVAWGVMSYHAADYYKKIQGD
jgi:tRNA G18 (ribose-2'-O)-methylase SpoU